MGKGNKAGRNGVMWVAMARDEEGRRGDELDLGVVRFCLGRGVEVKSGDTEIERINQLINPQFHINQTRKNNNKNRDKIRGNLLVPFFCPLKCPSPRFY